MCVLCPPFNSLRRKVGSRILHTLWVPVLPSHVLLCAKFKPPFYCHFPWSCLFTQSWDFVFLPQCCLGAHPERCGGLFWMLYWAAGSRIAVLVTGCAMCTLLEKATLARWRLLHKAMPLSTWQQSANLCLIHISSEQGFNVSWQWVRSCWAVVCSHCAPSL